MTHNRKCPKCGSGCVGCIFEDTKEGYDKKGHYWEGMGIVCGNLDCDFEIETESSNP